MTPSATEIIALDPASSASPEMSYAPVWISKDRREPDPTKTTLKYSQVGGPTAADKIGNAHGPIYMVEFVDVTGITATHIKVWGIDNNNASAVVYPKTYFTDNPKLYVWLDKFEFTDAAGTPVSGGSYTIMGHRKNYYPAVF